MQGIRPGVKFSYELVEEEGPDHNKPFDGQCADWGEGVWKRNRPDTKKAAEQRGGLPGHSDIAGKNHGE